MLERSLTIINELSTALILLILGLVTLSDFLVAKDEKLTVLVERPVYHDQVIGTIKYPEHVGIKVEIRHEKIVRPVPSIVEGAVETELIRTAYSGNGNPTVTVTRREVLIPSIGNPPYVTLNKKHIPNIKHTGSGLYYDHKEVVFDGVNEPRNVKANLEIILGSIAIGLLVLRFYVWIRLAMKGPKNNLFDSMDEE